MTLSNCKPDQHTDYPLLADKIKQLSRELGFQHCQISDIELGVHAVRFKRWLANNYHGTMDYMDKHGGKRCQPEQLQPNCQRVISFRMDYLPVTQDGGQLVLQQADKAYIARYALGRDYHKLMRKRLASIAKLIEKESGSPHHRAFVDSAPILERAFAEKAGLGWIGKNTLLINARAGSWFFLGEILTDAPLPIDPPQNKKH